MLVRASFSLSFSFLPPSLGIFWLFFTEFIPQAFSIPLSQVICNDRAHRQRQESYRQDPPQREEHKDSSDLVSSIIQVCQLAYIQQFSLCVFSIGNIWDKHLELRSMRQVILITLQLCVLQFATKRPSNKELSSSNSSLSSTSETANESTSPNTPEAAPRARRRVRHRIEIRHIHPHRSSALCVFLISCIC